MRIVSSGSSEKVRRQLEGLAYCPELFLRDIDPKRNAAILSPMSADSYRRSSFLDNRLVRVGERDIVVPSDALIRLLEKSGLPAGTIHYIFHVGHCGSTLISRLLGELDDFHALREPAVLMGLSRSYSALDEPGFEITRERWAELRDFALTLLARTWQPGQTVLLKATSHAGNLIPQLMSHTRKERAMFLYLDLETYLVTMLRSHTRRENRHYARDFRIREFADLAPSRSAKFQDYSDARIAALTWLLHTREIANATRDPDIEARILLMTFDEFLATPKRQLDRVCRFMGATVDERRLENLLAGPTARSHSKLPDSNFDSEKRTRELAAVRQEFSNEIDAGLVWAAQVCSEDEPFAGLIDRFSCSTAP